MTGNSPATLACYISFDFVLLFNIPSIYHFYSNIMVTTITFARCFLVFGS